MLHCFPGNPPLQLFNLFLERLNDLTLLGCFLLTELMSSNNFLLRLHQILLCSQLPVFPLNPAPEIPRLQVEDYLLLGILFQLFLKLLNSQLKRLFFLVKSLLQSV